MKFLIGVCTSSPRDIVTLGQRVVAPTISALKKRLAEHPETSWVVALFDDRVNRETLMQLIEDYTEYDFPNPPIRVYVNPKGKCEVEE